MGKTTIKVTEIDSGDTSVKTKKTSKKTKEASKTAVAKATTIETTSAPTEVAVVPVTEEPKDDKKSAKKESKAKESAPEEAKTSEEKPESTEKALAVIEPKEAPVVIEPIEATPEEVTKPAEAPTKIVVEEPKAEDKPETQPKPAKKPSSKKKTAKQPVVAPQPEPMKLPLFRRIYVKVGYVLGAVVLIALIAFFGRVAIWEHNYLDRMEGSERDTATSSDGLPVDSGEDDTDDTEPTEAEIYEYTVAPDMPRYLSIPNVRIYKSRVLEVGVKPSGEMATPYNIYDTGWYVDSAIPGNNGVSIINGHGGAPGIGIFGNLPLVSIGDEVIIEMGDGRQYTYRIADTATKALGEEANNYMANYAFSSPEPGVPSLTLITCTGDYWLSSRTYSHRFFARALLVQ